MAETKDLDSYFHSKKNKVLWFNDSDPSIALYFIKGDYSVLKLDERTEDHGIRAVGNYEEDPMWRNDIEILSDDYDLYSIIESKILGNGIEIETSLFNFKVTYSDWEEIEDAVKLSLKSRCYYYPELIIENLFSDEKDFDIYDLRFINDKDVFTQKLKEKIIGGVPKSIKS